MKRKASAATMYAPVRRQNKRPRRTYSTPIPRMPMEIKCTDSLANASSVSSSGLLSDLFLNMVGGTSWYNQYVGQKITPTSIELRYQFVCADVTQIMRCIVFQWFDSGSAPTTATVLQSLNALSPKQINNRSEMKILADRLHHLSIFATGGNYCVGDRIHIKANKMQSAIYNAATGRYKGQLYALWISDSSVVVHPTVTFYSRVYYSDV